MKTKDKLYRYMEAPDFLKKIIKLFKKFRHFLNYRKQKGVQIGNFWGTIPNSTTLKKTKVQDLLRGARNGVD